jgi:5-amino-6-(5-phospho-D-ribitylamino)uracil phosphatase
VRLAGDGEAVKYKMIAIDLDGTLLSPQGRVTPRTRSAVQRVLDTGLLVCFATGRNFTESKGVLESVGHFDSAVFVGGAMVIDTRRQITLHRTLMEAQLARELCQFFESRSTAVLALQDTTSAGVDYLVSRDIPLNEATTKWLDVTSATVKRMANLSRHSHEHTIRVGVVAPADLMAEMNRELLQIFGSRIVSHKLIVPAYGVDVLEVFDPAVNKWEGILHVARRHRIDPSEIIAIGDDINDVPMVQNAGLGIAMANAHPHLLKVADRVIGHNRDDGLAQFLEELAEKNLVERINLDQTPPA